MSKIVKAKAIAGFKNSCASLYNVEIWYDSYDLNKRGRQDYVPYEELLTLSGGKKGWNFKKVNSFLETETGLQWIDSFIKNRGVK